MRHDLVAGSTHRDVRLARVALLALALSPVALLLRSPGAGDVGLWLDWLAKARGLGVVRAYQQTAIDYPPGSQVLLWVTGESFPWLGQLDQLKVLLVAGLLASALVLGLWFASVNAATVMIASFTISAIGLGYLDILWAPALVLSLWALQRGRLGAFGALFAVACTIKWQPLVLAPVFLLYIVLTKDSAIVATAPLRRLIRTLLPAALVGIVALLLFNPVTVLKSLAGASMHGLMSGNALNLPWLFGALDQDLGSAIAYVSIDDVPGWMPLACRVLALASYAVVLLAFWRGGRTFGRALVAGVLMSLAYFAFNIGVHENHLFLPCLLAVIGVFLLPAYREAFLVVIVMAQVNLLIFYGVTGVQLIDRVAMGFDLTIPLAVLFLGSIAVIAMSLGRFLVSPGEADGPTQ